MLCESEENTDLIPHDNHVGYIERGNLVANKKSSNHSLALRELTLKLVALFYLPAFFFNYSSSLFCTTLDGNLKITGDN